MDSAASSANVNVANCTPTKIIALEQLMQQLKISDLFIFGVKILQIKTNENGSTVDFDATKYS